MGYNTLKALTAGACTISSAVALVDYWSIEQLQVPIPPAGSCHHETPHVLRHTCALTILQATGDLRKVSLWLGHADMQTTMAYLRADPSEKLATVTAVVPMPGRRARLRAPDKLIGSLHRR